MQFTPQQLSGGPKYSSSTRIGNWQEEISLEESKLADFRKRSNRGNLAIRILESKIALFTQKVGHTYSPDGVIRFGDVIMLQHQKSNHYLACDPYEDFSPGSNKFFVSCTNSGDAIARSTFRIVRPPTHLENVDSDPNDPILRIGQAFCLMVNEILLTKPDSNLLSPPLYLCSTKKNERNATKITNRQLVFLSPNNDSESIWFTVKPSQGRANASQRFLCLGNPVNINDIYLITHRQTNCCLICDPKQRDHTDFGVELECYADRTNEFGKLSLMVSEFKGISTPFTLSKPDAPNYFWRVVTSNMETVDNFSGASIEAKLNPPSPATTNRSHASLNTTSTIALLGVPSDIDLISEFQRLVGLKGIDAFLNLRQFYISADSEFDGKIDRVDLKDGLICWGMTMDTRYLDRIIDMIDNKRTNNIVDFSKFMSIVCGNIPSNRLDIINRTWRKLDPNNTGKILVEDLVDRFDATYHPLRLIGNQSNDRIWGQFVVLCKSRRSNNAPVRESPATVTKQAFVDYYSDLSAGISCCPNNMENENFFENAVTLCWN